MRSAGLAFTQVSKRIAEIVLGPGPIERHALAREFFQGILVNTDGIAQPLIVTLLVTVLIECGPIAIAVVGTDGEVLLGHEIGGGLEVVGRL